jgi:hypothetical protein
MNINELLVECKEPISSEKAQKLTSSFSFDNNQIRVADLLLSASLTETQKYLLLDGLAGTDLSKIKIETIENLQLRYQNDVSSVKRMMQDLVTEFYKEKSQ